MTFRLSQVRLLVTDFPACFRFYRDVLGFQPDMGEENDVYAHFVTGGAELELFKRDLMAQAVGMNGTPIPSRDPDVAVLIIGVEDVDAASADLRAKGVPQVYPPTDRQEWGTRSAHFRDPDGYLLEIWQSLDQNGASAA